MRSQTFTTTIVSGGTLSGVFGVRGIETAGLMIPAITSAQVCLAVAQGSGDSFMRAFKTDGSSHFVISAGPGSMGVPIGDIINGFTHARIETLAVQADNRSFVVVVKF